MRYATREAAEQFERVIRELSQYAVPSGPAAHGEPGQEPAQSATTQGQIEHVRHIVSEYLREEPPAPPDPVAAREARRREIDALLREDARACPAFAKARLRAVMAAMEPPPLVLARALPPGVWRAMAGAFMQKRWSQREPGGAFAMPPEAKIEMLEAKGHGPNEVTLTRDILAELHYYEAHRGGERRPRRDRGRCVPPAVAEAVEVYERSRGLA